MEGVKTKVSEKLWNTKYFQTLNFKQVQNELHSKY